MIPNVVLVFMLVEVQLSICMTVQSLEIKQAQAVASM